MSIAPIGQADPLSDILDYLEKMYGAEVDIKNTNQQIVGNTQKQIDEQKNEWRALTQVYGMGDNRSDQNARLWSASDWQDVLQRASGGNSQRFQQLMQSYAGLYPVLQKGGSAVDPKALVNHTYTQTGQTYNAALSASAYTYDDIIAVS
jgi:hypothetical protein